MMSRKGRDEEKECQGQILDIKDSKAKGRIRHIRSKKRRDEDAYEADWRGYSSLQCGFDPDTRSHQVTAPLILFLGKVDAVLNNCKYFCNNGWKTVLGREQPDVDNSTGDLGNWIKRSYSLQGSQKCDRKATAMETWSVDQVCSWLVEKNLGELVHRFQEEEVSGAALLALNDRMVQQLVKKIGHQAVLMDLIKKYKQKSQELKSPGETALVKQAEAPPEDEQSSSRGEQMPSFYPVENHNNDPIDQRVLKQRWD
ncbi:hypothetical protein E2I00_017918 [Balaenoptera physalus]|uniref:SAM domain-containing protein n=1 Tax=Balaenoptera physalus TaxID=9770 RepID=A0A643BME6_BALPH|nr:hypothetical protein E2I00_017918 [Balaenoptera physalus]